MSYKGLKVAVGLVLAVCCGAAYGAAPPDLIVVRKPIASIPWGLVETLAFSPDGKYLAVTGAPSQWLLPDVMTHPAARKGGSVACWTIADWKRVSTPRLDAFYRERDAGKLVWTPDSTRLLIYDSNITPNTSSKPDFTSHSSVWSRDGWRLLSTTQAELQSILQFTSPDGATFVSPTGAMAQMEKLIRESPDGSDVSPTAGGSDIRPDEFSVCDVRTGSVRFLANVSVDPPEKSGKPEYVPPCATFSSDGKWLAVSSGDRVCLVNIATRAVVSRRRMPDNVQFLRFQPSTQNLLITYGQRLYQLLAAPDLTLILSPGAIGSGSSETLKSTSICDVQFVANGKWFAVASFSTRDVPFEMTSVITLVNSASMKAFGTIGPVKSPGGPLFLLPDGSKVVWATTKLKNFPIGETQMLVFRTSTPGGPTPDAWIKAHGASSKPAGGQRPLAPMTPAGVRQAVPVPTPAPVPTPTPAPVH